MLHRIIKKVRYIFTTSHRGALCMDFDGYAKQARGDVSVTVVENHRLLQYQREQLFGEEHEPIEKEAMAATYIAQCKDALIIGGSSVVVSSNGTILYDLLYHKEKYNANVTDHGLFMLTGKPFQKGSSYFYNYTVKEKQAIPSGVSLACNMSGNYYHFIYDCAARLTLLSKGMISKEVPLLVDECVLAIPSMKDILMAMNIEDREIIPLKENVAYTVRDLFVLSPVNKVIPNTMDATIVAHKGHSFDPTVLHAMRRRLLPLSNKESNMPKRIFISRNKCLLRKLNEEELFPILKDYGFDRVFTEGMSLVEQITLFANAEHIVASSGAALSNLLFCRPGTRVLIFISPRRPGIYSSLALSLELDCQALLVKSDEKTLHPSHLKAKPGELKKYLTSIYG